MSGAERRTWRSDAGRRPAGLLVLADGTTFEGEAAGWWDPERPVPAVGEVVFNTTLTGYQEVLTDPSYAGQIVCFTYPHIGNYGITAADNESRRAFCRGLIVRELAPRPSSWRSQRSLGDFLVDQRLPGLEGIDTRRLTRHIRDAGAMPGAFGPVSGPAALAEAAIVEAARSAPGHRRRRPGRRGDHRRALHDRRRSAAGRRLRLRDQTHHPAPPRPSGHRHRGPGVDPGRGGAGRTPGRGLPFQRPG